MDGNLSWWWKQCREIWWMACVFGEVRVDGGVDTREEVDTGEYFISRNIENMLRVLVSICKRPHIQDSEFSELKFIPALMAISDFSQLNHFVTRTLHFLFESCDHRDKKQHAGQLPPCVVKLSTCYTITLHTYASVWGKSSSLNSFKSLKNKNLLFVRHIHCTKKTNIH